MFAIAFTDSVHSLTHQEAPDSVFEFYEKVNKISVILHSPYEVCIIEAAFVRYSRAYNCRIECNFFFILVLNRMQGIGFQVKNPLTLPFPTWVGNARKFRQVSK